jgi:Transposase DDE domain
MLFERIDAILTESRIDDLFLDLALQDQSIDLATAAPQQLASFAQYSFVCLRSCIARKISGLAHREFCVRLADSQLLQWFLHVGQVDQVKVFAKSTSHRFDNWLSEASLRTINEKLIALCIMTSAEADSPPPFDLKESIEIDDAFFDTTCLKSNIHFPVDWVLLCDAVRTLMKATICIRKAGLKVRMPQDPADFMRDMNKLCMAMAAQRRASESKKNRKAILRKMKRLTKCVGAHAKAHRDALTSRWAETDLSEGQARVIIQRLQNVLDQLPAAIDQAHERIIGERPVANEDKILSLYDDELNVIVRGKAGAEVEFGNKFSLVENAQGLIIDYKLHSDNPSDSKLVEPSVKRMIEVQKLPIKRMWSDRGMSSKSNEKMLESYGIASGLCPRNPSELKEKMEDPEYRAGMKRRGATEARIAIFKNVIQNNPMREKSFLAREKACAWAVLSHNVWVLARMERAEKKEQKTTEAPPARQQQAA